MCAGGGGAVNTLPIALGKVRYGLNTLLNAPVRLGTNSISAHTRPLGKSVCPPKIPRVPVYLTEHTLVVHIGIFCIYVQAYTSKY